MSHSSKSIDPSPPDISSDAYRASGLYSFDAVVAEFERGSAFSMRRLKPSLAGLVSLSVRLAVVWALITVIVNSQ